MGRNPCRDEEFVTGRLTKATLRRELQQIRGFQRLESLCGFTPIAEPRRHTPSGIAAAAFEWLGSAEKGFEISWALLSRRITPMESVTSA